MQPEDRIQKSASGRAALAGRSADLPAPLRTLLLMVYGDKTVAQYAELASRLPVGRDGVQRLTEMGLVEVVPKLDAMAILPQAAQPTAASAPLVDVVESKSTHTLDEAAQLKLIYPEFIQAVSDIGLRGVLLQMSVERAVSAKDLLALRDQVEAALVKSKGEAARQAFSDRLNSLLSKFYWS
jgi:hypothetical protein